ncbi:MAG: zinc/iron-chelating domain-containing protein [Planctomycetes bacterium]|nr:zinc/iron-chelating domain-containing protein [Planctomycetota bacterium]
MQRSVTAHVAQVPRSRPPNPPKPWYSNGLRFECTQCGNCCRNHGEYTFVYLSERDIEAISTHLDLPREEFLERHCRKESGWVTLRMDAPACPFLLEDQRCAIYPARPKQCATWPFWEENLKRQTWEGSVQKCCPGIDKGTLFGAAEIERIARETEEWYAEDEEKGC